jgi:hypothetical protein
MRRNADRNAGIVIGKRRLARYHQTFAQEKRQAPLATERSTKVGGVSGSQVAKGKGRLSTNLTRHGARNAQGTAKDAGLGAANPASGIAHPLRLFNES